MLWSLTIKLNKAFFTLFGLLTATFALLAGGVVSETTDKVAGWFGIATSLAAWYIAYAEIFNEVVGGGKVIIPLGQWSSNKIQEPEAAKVIDDTKDSSENEKPAVQV